MPIDTLLFDLDGTLVDSSGDLATAVNLLRGECGLAPLPVAEVCRAVGDGATLLVKRTLPGGLFSAERLARFLELYAEHLCETTRPYPGIMEFLAARRGWPLAVVTNKPERHTLALLEGLGLMPFFGVVIGGDSCAHKKPHPLPVQEALRRLGRAGEGAVLLGDHHNDLRAGRAAGIRTCFCAWGVGEDGGWPADYRAATPAELEILFP